MDWNDRNKNAESLSHARKRWASGLCIYLHCSSTVPSLGVYTALCIRVEYTSSPVEPRISYVSRQATVVFVPADLQWQVDSPIQHSIGSRVRDDPPISLPFSPPAIIHVLLSHRIRLMFLMVVPELART